MSQSQVVTSARHRRRPKLYPLTLLPPPSPSPPSSIPTSVFTDNTHAIHAYKKLGFEQTGFVPRAGRVTRAGVTTYQDAVQLHFDLRSVEIESENSPEGR